MPADLTPAERSLGARIAVNASWAKTKDRKARSAPGLQAANVDRYARESTPTNELAPEERSCRAAFARRSYMQALALKSSKARRLRWNDAIP